jgi:acetyltransferase-like isoleucine patch superfamily enzyme
MVFGINNILKNLSIPMMFLQIKRLKQAFTFREKKLIISSGCNIDHSKFGINNFLGQNVNFVNSEIGNYSYIGNNSKIKNTKIGNFCSIGPNVQIILGKHPTNLVSTHPAFYSNNKQFKTFSDINHIEEYGSVTIGNDVWISEGVIIPNDVIIGNGAIIAARSIVTKDVEPYAIVAGSPAKLIKFRFDKLTCEKIQNSEWWKWDEKKLKINHAKFQDPDNFINSL